MSSLHIQVYIIVTTSQGSRGHPLPHSGKGNSVSSSIKRNLIAFAIFQFTQKSYGSASNKANGNVVHIINHILFNLGII